MRFFYKLSLALTLFYGSQSKAFTPESGFWWNPNESGSGYAIEIQDNYLFVALYVYDEFGNPIWYTAGATLGGNSFFDSSLNYTYNGTCIDCVYSQPITILGERGPITIEFLTETTATIQFQGAVKHIERFNFLLGDEAERMLGEWQTVIDFSSTGSDFPFNGDILIFDLISISGGDKYAEGCRPDNSVDGYCSSYAYEYHDMASLYDYQSNQLIVVVNDSTDYWLAYYLDLGLNQFDGVAELYPKNSGNNFIYYPVRGFRTASRSFIETGVGPSSNGLKSVKENNTGISDRLNIPENKKSLSDFSEKEQTKIMRQHTMVQTLINKLESQ